MQGHAHSSWSKLLGDAIRGGMMDSVVTRSSRDYQSRSVRMPI